MAYNTATRFPPDPKCYNLLDPGAYTIEKPSLIKPKRKKPRLAHCRISDKNMKVAFLSSAPRNTQTGPHVWTDATYDTYYPQKIPNCTSIMSKRPRFPYEALSKEDLEEILCKCGIDNKCECTSEEQEIEVNCQGNVPRRFFKGSPPRSRLGVGLSAPSKTHKGFDVGPDGSVKRRPQKILTDCPPFYDTRVNEFTAFYHGCKWSKWSSKRGEKLKAPWPGPADYNTTGKELSDHDKCVEKLKEYRRMTSKQLRYIEILQQRNILEAQPGPSTYTPKSPRGTDMSFLGAKAARFKELCEEVPGPADYYIKRKLDPSEPPQKPCVFKLYDTSCLGGKAARFKPSKEESPGPASYTVNKKICKILHCHTAPFGVSEIRFKEIAKNESDEEEEPSTDLDPKLDKDNDTMKCKSPTWVFKSKTIRMKPLIKKFDEPSPGDVPQQGLKVPRSNYLQYIAPFYSSVGRFRPWNNEIGVFGRLNTPGPAYYNLEKPRCIPAVTQGPLVRSERFPQNYFSPPAANAYIIGGGVETVLDTHNLKLKNNIVNQHQFCFKPVVEPRKLTIEEKEAILINKCIALLEGDTFTNISKQKSEEVKESKTNPKLLRCFLYNKQFPNI